jgi:hypothetical protein
MSYHNGSIWPHDTALCAAGIARYGHRDAAVQLLRSAFEAAVHFDMRLPELFCGFRACRAPADRLSRRVHAAGVGRGRAVHAAAGVPGREIDGLRGEIQSIGRACRMASTKSASTTSRWAGSRRPCCSPGRNARGMFVEGRGDRVPPVRLRS